MGRIQISVTRETDASGEFFTYACGEGWTDGLPVIPPTPQRVEEMLEAVARRPDEVLAVMPPRKGPATVESIAINAVMAGCLPEYFPVVLAGVEAIADTRFPLGTLVGLRPETPFLLVNGPVRDAIGLNYERGCLGPGWRGNATIGRAIRLVMINVAGLSPGGYARAAFASPLQYTFCTGEDEVNSPWEPLHVERGFQHGASVVSVFRVTSYVALLAPLDWDQSPQRLLEHTALSMVSLGNTALYAGNLSALVVMNPERAQTLADGGLSKRDVKQKLFQESILPPSHFKKSDLAALEEKGRISPHGVTLVDGPDHLQIAVLGGSGIHTVFLPGFAHEMLPTVPVSKEVHW